MIHNEYAFLYCALNNPDALKEAIHISADIFNDSISINMIKTIKELNKKNLPININSIKNYIGDMDYEVFRANIPKEVNVENYSLYADVIKNNFSYVKLENASAYITSGIESKLDPVVIVKKVQERIKEVYSTKNIGKIYRPFDIIEGIEDKLAAGDAGIYWGFEPVDKIVGTFEIGDLVVVAARPSMGKCLGAGTKVVMFDGKLKKVEDIEIGDLLMGSDSTPRKVLSTTTGIEQMYWVRQKRGIDYRVNESHILSLKRSRNEFLQKNGDILNLTVKEYISKSNKFKTNYKGYKVPITFKEQKLELDPYIFGLWLGDGDTGSQDISNTDKIVMDAISSYAEFIGDKCVIHRYDGKCPTIRIKSSDGRKNSFTQMLRNIGVIGDKHIPHKYIQNSTKNRLELLAGIIDSDGYYQGQSCIFEIMQKKEELAGQIKMLCDSLGFCASLKKVTKKIKSTGFTGEYYRIVISGNIDIIPTRLLRKKARKLKSNRNWRATAITIEKDIVDTYYGFELDGDGLFLLEDMTVTHNTAKILDCMLSKSFYENEPTGISSLEMGEEIIVKRMISNVAGINLKSIRLNKLTERQAERYATVRDQLKNSPIHIITNCYTIPSLESNLEILKSQVPNMRFFFLDYIQLMASTNEGVTEVINGLKRIAKNLELILVAASQLSRLCEQREDKRPILSDLRESGTIEQTADIVMFLYRDSYYNKAKEALEKGKSPTELIIAKNRNGETGVAKAIFNRNIQRFVIDKNSDSEPYLENNE